MMKEEPQSEDPDLESQEPILEREWVWKAKRVSKLLDEIYEIRVTTQGEWYFVGFVTIIALIVFLIAIWAIVSLLVAIIMSPNLHWLMNVVLALYILCTCGLILEKIFCCCFH